MTDYRIALAQTQPVTGDLEGNVRQILAGIERAKTAKADIVAFPETSITGYCCGALFENREFVAYNKRFLAEIIAPAVPNDLVAIVGYVDVKGERKDHHPDIANSVAVIQGGKIVGTYDKQLLANGNHHEDKKYFRAGVESKVFEVTVQGKPLRIGTPICEDIWKEDHERDIIGEMRQQGAELIVCPNYSYFFYGKQEHRKEICQTQARGNDIPIAYLNASGVGDIVKNIMIYDGGSFVIDRTGKTVGEARRFGTDFTVVDLKDGKGTPLPAKPAATKMEEIHDSLVFEQRELYRTLGIPNCQVHMSGGIDSAVVGAIAAEAMGKEHVVFITNPTKDNGDITKGNATHIAQALDVPLHWQPTQAAYEMLVDGFRDAFTAEPDNTAKGNMQALLRTAQGLTSTRHFRSAIAATGNHTEIVHGWCTFHDIGSIGAHAPLGDLTKVEVFQLAAHINERAGREIIPAGLYDGSVAPMAELADAKEDPFDYYVISGIDAEMIRHRRSVAEIIDAYRTRTLTPEFFPPGPDGKDVYARTDLQGFASATWDAFERSKRSVFKAAQAAPIVIISPRSRGFSNRETIINAYAGWYDLEKAKTRLRGAV